jgi:hypothetical protein
MRSYTSGSSDNPPEVVLLIQMAWWRADRARHCRNQTNGIAQVCLAVLRAAPMPDWCSTYFGHVGRTLAAYSAQELANTLTAAAFLQLDPGACSSIYTPKCIAVPVCCEGVLFMPQLNTDGFMQRS